MLVADRVNVLGVDCYAGTLGAAAEETVSRARSGEDGYVCLCSAHGVVLSHHDRELKEALAGAWRVFPDGYPVAWLARRRGAAHASQITGTDLMAGVFAAGQEAGLRHFLFGSTPDTLARLEASLRERYPKANIVGSLSPSFAPLDPAEAERDAATIRTAQPNVVWVGFSTPKQDLWMRRYAKLLGPAVVLGVGAAFDFHAGTKQRAPVWMRRTSLEWLHRLLSEPRRLATRYARIVAEFSLRAAIELARGKRSS